MSHEHDQDRDRDRGRASETTARGGAQADTIEPAQVSRSAVLRKPDHAVPSGLVQAKAVHALAAEGISGTATTLPFLDAIQRSFGSHDVRAVQAHVDDRAAAASAGMGARAYATGDHVAFGGTPDLHTAAHEAAHVVQQRAGVHLAGGVGAAGDAYEQHADQVADAVVAGRSAEALLGGFTGGSGGSSAVQRAELDGAAGETATDEDRPLSTTEGTLEVTAHPGGTIIEDTETETFNCAGDSMGIQTWIDWPHLGRHTDEGISEDDLDGNWEAAKAFVPFGCTRVGNDGISINSTRCKPGEVELIVFLYRWPCGRIQIEEDNKPPRRVTVYESDFHMIGRNVDALPCGWHSKMDQREQVQDIRSPLQSLHDAYPHTLEEDRQIVQLTFCGKQDQFKLK